jgi:hypothetical protein
MEECGAGHFCLGLLLIALLLNHQVPIPVGFWERILKGI